MLVVAGAPNALRGASHSGNVSAAQLLAEGLVDALASDYLPSALLGAAARIVRDGTCDLPAAVHLVTAGPAAVAGFTALGCEGLSRVDFFLTADGTPIINEINTMPGFTAISMYPRMWGDAGVPYPELITRLIEDALRRGTGLR